MLFFAGAANVLLAMGWWTVWLLDAHVHPLGLPQPPIHAGFTTGAAARIGRTQ